MHQDFLKRHKQMNCFSACRGAVHFVRYHNTGHSPHNGTGFDKSEIRVIISICPAF